MSRVNRTIERWAERHPSKVALHYEGEDWTFRRLWESVVKASLPVSRGDRVAWLGYNSPQMLVLLFAAARQGAIIVPLNWRLTAAEHRQILADCAPKFLYCDAAFEAHAKSLGVPIGGFDQPRPVEEAEDILIVYTSGTTGDPKGAVLTQSALLANAANSAYAHALTQDDHVLTALPLFHVGGLNIQTLPALLAGASVTLHPRFNPGRWLDDVSERRPTLSLLVPATMAAVIGHPQWAKTDLASLKLLNTGSMVVPESLIRAF